MTEVPFDALAVEPVDCSRRDIIGLLTAELEELEQVLRTLAREMKIALLVVEHRLELLAAIADEVLVLDVGRRIMSGAPEEVFNNPEVQAAYFDTAKA